jgi:hypothetical protein
MSRLNLPSGLLAIGILFPLPAHAHGEEGVISIFLIVIASHLIPVADLLRRRLWSKVAFFLFTQPVLWCIAGATGYCVAMIGHFFVGEQAMPFAVIVGFIVFAVLPFIYWRRLLRWSNADA